MLRTTEYKPLKSNVAHNHKMQQHQISTNQPTTQIHQQQQQQNLLLNNSILQKKKTETENIS